MQALNSFLVTIGRGVGKVVGTLYQAGRDAVDQVIKNVIPFMAFISFIIGLILATHIGDWLANLLSGFANNIVGLLILSLIIGLPVLSPLLGPGAVIAQIIGTLLGTLIGKAICPSMWPYPHCGPSTRKSAVTSSQWVWRSVRPNQKRLKWVCRRCCSRALLLARLQCCWAMPPASFSKR
jgi:Sorbitol phosphotransferase enzyme II N-terminus